MRLSKLDSRRLYGSIVTTVILVSVFVGTFHILPVVGEDGTWWNTDWQYRRLVTVNHTRLEASLSNFPVMVHLNSSNFDFDKTKANLEDIRFTDYDGNLLSYEIETFTGNVGGDRNWSRVLVDDNRVYTDGAHNMVPFDIDVDGNLELVTCSYRADSLQFYKYYGDSHNSSNWVRYIIDNNVGGGTVGSGAQYLAIADINGDGRMDLILAEDQQQEDVVAYLAPVDRLNVSAWEKHILFDDDALGVYQCEAGDIDGDGDLDISIVTRSARKVGWLENNGTLDNWPVTWIDQNVRDPFYSRISDLDHDGKGEFICNYASTSAEDGYVLWYNYSGDPRNPANWVKHIMANVGTGSVIGSYSLEIVDMDFDGNLDVVTCNFDQNDMYVIENPYPGNMTDMWPKYKVHDDYNSRESGVGDIDGDGDLDIVGADSNKNAAFWLENPGNPFTPSWKDHVIDSSGTYLEWTVCAELGDIDKDGDLDVAAAASGHTSSTGCTFQWYVNEPFEKEVVIWVKLPSISNDTDTKFYMYYGNPSAPDGQDVMNVWDSNFVLVHHMNGSTYTALHDSTLNKNDVTTQNGSPAYQQSGKIGDAVDFEASTTDYVQAADSNSLDITQGTVELWAKFESVSAWEGVVAKEYNWAPSDYDCYGIYLTSSSTFRWQTWNGGWHYVDSTVTASAGMWCYVAGSYDGSNMQVYINDNAAQSVAYLGSFSTSAKNLFIGYGQGLKLDGLLDEIRISTTARSSAWIKATYDTGRDHLLDYGAEERLVPAKLYIDPPLIEKGPGDIGTTFKVNVTVEKVVDLFGFDFNLTWNSSLLTLASVEFGTTLDNIWGHDNWFVAYNETGPGYYQLAAVSISTGFNSTVAKPLATMEFRVEDTPPGETPIHFAIAKLSNSSGKAIPVEVRDATYKRLQETVLMMSPDPVEKTYLDYGTYFNVSVMIKDTTDLFGFDLNITWESMLITYHTSYSYTLDIIWGVGNWQEIENEAGAGWYKFVALSTKDGFSFTGSQALLIIEFRVEGPICNSMKETSIHFATHKLSNSHWISITHTAQDGTYRIVGKTPTLQMNPTSLTCRIYDEHFAIKINVSDACNVEDFEFEINYNSTLLDYVNVSWNLWGSGTINVDESNGNIAGYTSGTPVSGNLTLMTMEFRAAYHHVWKDENTILGWRNDLTGAIFFQWANLSYPSAPDLRYVRGGAQNQINVGSDVLYTFSPIQGDVYNDGDVDIYDLRTVATYYNVKEGDPLWVEASKYDLTKPVGENIIDIYDLRIIASNYGYTYP